MKLLIVTQTVDTEDLVLGFFVSWIAELARHTESIEVLCLKKGTYQLPSNVHVYSLGKELKIEHRLVYAYRFLIYAWRLRMNYDSVFVHMNQEYILIAGCLWKLLGKKIYLWRNHYAGSWQTDLAALFCNKVFCTSVYSYTAKYAKTVRMPIGVDTERYTPSDAVTPMPNSILFFGRLAPSKRPELLIEALAMLARKGMHFKTTIAGTPLPIHESYATQLHETVCKLDLAADITFVPGVPNYEAVDLFRSHELYVNASLSGMFDKTIAEAAACGCTVLASSKDFASLTSKDFFFENATELAERLLTSHEINWRDPLAVFVQANSLHRLGEQLIRELSSESGK